MQRDRVIIDTNLWISFLLTKHLSKLDALIKDKELVLIFSGELLDEFVEVTQREKFRKYFTLDDVESLLFKLKDKAEFIVVTSHVNACRDLKDNFLLSLAIDGKATHLITGDNDLLVLRRFGVTKIITITEYLATK